MQIIPSSPTSKPSLDEMLLGSRAATDQDRDSFADELARQQEARQSVADGLALSVQSALLNSPAPEPAPPLTTAPYSRNTTDGITYSTEEVCFTQQEVQEVRTKLEQSGAPAESLRELDKLAQQPDGATLAQIMASLHQGRSSPTLSESESNALKSLTQKIDSTGALGATMAEHIAAGNGKKALEALTAAMGALPSGTRITMDKSEIAALGKATGLSKTAQGQMLGNFGPYDSLQLNRADMDSFLAPAYNEFLQADAAQKKLNKALDATLGPILKKAKDRMEAEKAATELANKRTAQSKTLIQKTVMENVNDTLEGTRQAVGDQMQGVKVPHKADKTDTTDKIDKANAAQHSGKQEAGPSDQAIPGMDAKAVSPKEGAGLGQGQDLHQDADPRDKKSDKNARKADGREELAGKITEVRTPASPTAGQVTTPVIGINTGVTMPDVKTMPQGVADKGTLSRAAVSQVEQAMLSSMSDGTKRLELQLHPAELGSLTLQLSVRNGEVSATIRSERGETADMLNRQLDTLRSTLEQQGIKVDKLEVQLQSPEDNSQQQWQSMQQHNARQEENARRDTLERMRMLGKIRNNGTNSEAELLEQGVQSLQYTAGNAAQSLHIVA